MTNPATTRLFLVWEQITPANSLLTFTNETGVENYYGVSSIETTMAKEYFSGPNATNATMLFTRVGLGQRPHLLGANISGLTFAQFQGINGSLSIDFNGVTYAGNVDLAGAANYFEAAKVIQTALRKALPVMARTTGGTITTETINFTGYVDSAQLLETSGPALVVGGKVNGAGMNIPSVDANQIIYSHSKLINGATHYSLFAGCGEELTPEPMTETYSVWRPGIVTSGAIEPGQLLVGNGIPKISAIISGDNKNGWVVNNPIVASGDFVTKATPLEVTSNTLVGKTQNHDWFSIQPNGAFGFDQNPSTLSFATGTAADVLGLSQASGAMDSSPGGQHPTMAQDLNQTVREAIAGGTLYTTFQDISQNRFDNSLTLWASKHPGETFLSEHFSAPPAGSTGGVSPNITAAAELFSLPTIELNERGFDQSSLNPWGIAASVGHGPST